MTEQQECEALPPLPASQPYVWVWIEGEKRFESANSIYFTADQMHAYARAALAATPTNGVKDVETKGKADSPPAQAQQDENK